MKDPERAAADDDALDAHAGGFEGPEQPSGNDGPRGSGGRACGSRPFVMAAINTRNIHRSNMLMGHAYGEDFVYDEMMITGPGEQGKQMADAIAGMDMMATSRRLAEAGRRSDEGRARERRLRHSRRRRRRERRESDPRRGHRRHGSGLRLDVEDDRRVRALPDGRSRRRARRHLHAGAGLRHGHRRTLRAHAGLTFEVEG